MLAVVLRYRTGGGISIVGSGSRGSGVRVGSGSGGFTAVVARGRDDAAAEASDGVGNGDVARDDPTGSGDADGLATEVSVVANEAEGAAVGIADGTGEHCAAASATTTALTVIDATVAMARARVTLLTSARV